MRTIIPFPRFHVVKSSASRDDGLGQGSTSESMRDPQAPVPEGEEPQSARVDIPRAEAVHASIIQLIRTVHGRFG